MARSFVIGDVHGHYSALCNLLSLIAPVTDDRVFLLGDLIDRGPDSALAIRLVQQEGYQALLGNHEEQLLRALLRGVGSLDWTCWLHMGGAATLSSFGCWDHLQSCLPWLTQLPTSIDLGNYFLSHAGLDPQRPLFAQGIREFCWSRENFLAARRPYFVDKCIVVGHTPTCRFPGIEPGQILAGPGWLNIDTGAYLPSSGWLTALDLQAELIYQVNVQSQQQRTLPLSSSQRCYVPGRTLQRISGEFRAKMAGH
jgi:serine/threonine protein phosphatase 1